MPDGLAVRTERPPQHVSRRSPGYGGHPYPFRIPARFEKRDGFIVLDQPRPVDRQRLIKRLGRISPSTLSKALQVLQEMFAE